MAQAEIKWVTQQNRVTPSPFNFGLWTWIVTIKKKTFLFEPVESRKVWSCDDSRYFCWNVECLAILVKTKWIQADVPFILEKKIILVLRRIIENNY